MHIMGHDIREGTTVEVTHESPPGQLTGADPYIKGWVYCSDGSEMLIDFDYFDDLEKL